MFAAIFFCKPKNFSNLTSCGQKQWATTNLVASSPTETYFSAAARKGRILTFGGILFGLQQNGLDNLVVGELEIQVYPDTL